MISIILKQARENYVLRLSSFSTLWGLILEHLSIGNTDHITQARTIRNIILDGIKEKVDIMTNGEIYDSIITAALNDDPKGHDLLKAAATYDNSRDWLGWHSDDDRYIDHSRPIAIVTLGNGRNIQFRKIDAIDKEGDITYDEPTTLFLEPGSLLLMGPGMQFTHQHRIPKMSHDVGPRISLTYRGLYRV